MGMFISCAQFTIAMRQHTRDLKGEPQPAVEHQGPAENERNAVNCSVIESARLYTGSMDHALEVRDHLEGLSDDDWWAELFLLHPGCFAFLHHRLQ
jgi:hypothetical protein